MEEKIKIFGAKTHNLKNIDLEIPKNKLVVICGLSGSGKSSLAFDTIYIEGQRRYLESLSSYARQFLGGFKKAEVEKIEGLSPTIAINQKTISFNPRSTVGTITEIYDYLRLLFARSARPICPNCNIEIKRQTSIEITEKIFDLTENFENLVILAPVISQKKGSHKGVIEQIERSGWPKVRIDGIIYPIEEAKTINLDKNKRHNIEVVVDEISFELFYKKVSLTEVLSKKEKDALKRKKKKIKAIINEEKQKILESVKKAIEISKGIVLVEGISKKERKEFIFSTLFSCPKCGLSLPKAEPNLFSFNSPYGACPICQGLGKKMEVEKSFLLNPELSLAEGAILPLERISRFGRRALGVSYLKWELEEILEEKGYSFNTPFKKLPKEIQDILLYGDLNFEGVIPRLEKVYYETESEFIRREISRYLVEKPCPECCGARLKKEA
ncbi:excinuclease ABC subunit A, partial [bacterium]|nr:excinuclease ABC subunit A [bacterium]